MRILYIDIDSLRPDHLGCYGYHRNSSPNIDRIASQGLRFENCYPSDVPCSPSRTALFTGRFGTHTGLISLGGTTADPFIEGSGRKFRSTLGETSWMHCLRQAGLKTTTVSSFGERHSTWHWYANFSEIYNPGKLGMDITDDITPIALDWLQRNGKDDNWFLHVNYWDVHAPYRTPLAYGEPFADEPIPEWLTEEVRQKHWQGCGPWSAQEGVRYGEPFPHLAQYKRQPNKIVSMAQVRQLFDGYDTAIRYVDDHIGYLMNKLADLGVLDETAIIISADHGENLGELNIYYDHHTADHCTGRVPLIINWPGKTASASYNIETGLIYQFDFAATVIELLGGKVPENWDADSFVGVFESGVSTDRDYLVLTQGSHTYQRSVRFDDYICIRSYHDGYHDFPDIMLFDLIHDPHEQYNISSQRSEIVAEAMTKLDDWYGQIMKTASHPQDPLLTVLQEGDPFVTQVDLPVYLQRLRDTGRSACADRLAAAHMKQ